MKLTALLLLGICGAVAWIVLLIATNFSSVAVGAGLFGALVLHDRAS
jgi:hypothetical protein